MHAKYNKIFFNAQMDIDLVRASSPLLLTFSKTATESFNAKQPVYVRVPIYIYLQDLCRGVSFCTVVNK